MYINILIFQSLTFSEPIKRVWRIVGQNKNQPQFLHEIRANETWATDHGFPTTERNGISSLWNITEWPIIMLLRLTNLLNIVLLPNSNIKNMFKWKSSSILELRAKNHGPFHRLRKKGVIGVKRVLIQENRKRKLPSLKNSMVIIINIIKTITIPWRTDSTQKYGVFFPTSYFSLPQCCQMKCKLNFLLFRMELDIKTKWHPIKTRVHRRLNTIRCKRR